MKTFLLLLVAVGGFVLYRTNVATRETVHMLLASKAELQQIHAYDEGKRLFISHWTSTPTGFAGWGEDSFVDARVLDRDLWLASGRLVRVVDGAPKSEPWLCVFDRRATELLLYSVGGATVEARTQIQHGGLARVIAESGLHPERFVATPLRDAVTPTAQAAWAGQAPQAQMSGGGGYWATPAPSLSTSQEVAKKMGLQGSALDQKGHR